MWETATSAGDCCWVIELSADCVVPLEHAPSIASAPAIRIMRSKRRCCTKHLLEENSLSSAPGVGEVASPFVLFSSSHVFGLPARPSGGFVHHVLTFMATAT